MKKLVSTANLPKEEWLALRKQGIGGSDAGAICGLNPYVSPMKVFLDKTSDVYEDTDNEAMRQGRDLEEYVAKRFMEETGKKVRCCNYMLACDDLDYSFMQANVDRMITGENAGLECKTASAYSTGTWQDGKIPPHYLCQCYHYMAVTGCDAWYLAVVVLGKDFLWFRIERDEEVINNLKDIERRFWFDHVLANIPPDPDGSDATEAYFKQRYAVADPEKSVILGSEYTEKFKRYEEISDLMKKLEQEKRTIEEEAKAFMDDAELGYADGYTVSWKAYESERLDSKALKAEKPEIYGEFVKTINSRRFMIKAA